ncbi:MAG: helix-turn-helix domain-containing protein [Clostridia bacterium]|nr:helix-turn-helix domain-containing protein [Clostridia bacterium]
MAKIVEKLAELILSSNKSISDISRKSGISRTMLYKIIKKEVSALSSDTISVICKAIDQPDSILFQIDNNLEPVSLGTNFVRVPVYGTIPAGVPIEMIDTSFIEDYEDISTELLKGNKKAFCLKVKGESMMPKFEDGDVLVLIQQEDCNSGDYCAVSINHTECTFKKVIKHPSGLTLQPLNPAFEPMFFTNREIEELPITILGVVKEARRSY